ncbi:MAG: mannitol dehydrogenase family protein [Acutalibacter sp.]|jgi:fructuronate reductase
MKLDKTILQDGRAPEGYALPAYDREAMVRRTVEAPTWLHFGAGNIFRAFPAVLCQRLLNQGEWDTGIICCEGYDGEIVTGSLRPYDNLAVAVSLLADGSMEKEIVGSIAQSLTLPEDMGRVQEIFRQPSLRMVSFTITEKGYAVTSAVKADMQVPPQQAKSFLAQLAACCMDRFEACAAPLALVSMDNCSHNGEKLRSSFFQILDAWKAAGYVSAEAYTYAQEKLSFPWSMIDKITPRPHESVQKALEADGWEGMDILVTEKHTYTGAFVNAEKPQYLVIEDDFPAGRPPLEKAGVLFTDRNTVNAVESMKVCTCLNPLHTALAVLGCLLGHTTIAGEMGDEDLRELVTQMSRKEGMPVVIDPGVIDPEQFLQEVLTQRFPNPFMPDTPQRIATDTSQKLPIRFGVDIGLHQKKGDSAQLQLMPLVLAAWLRYLKGVDDEGKEFTCSPDPLLEKLQPVVRALPFGEPATAESFAGLLEDETVWGTDLKAAGLTQKVVDYFNEMNAGPGAVRKTLHKAVSDAT